MRDQVASAWGMRVLIITTPLHFLMGCTPPLSSAPIAPVDASDASPCDIADAVSSARLIRSDGGAPLVVPCTETP